MKQKIYVVQHEAGGIPYEPEVCISELEAEAMFEEYLISLGFRPMKQEETFDEYYDFYNNAISDAWKVGMPEGCEGYDAEDDVVRMFILEQDLSDLISQHMINLAYFVYNFNYDFIEECWGADTNIGKHLRDKFSGIIHRHNHGFASAQCVMDFIMELSEGHKTKLFKYVIENYKGHTIKL